LIKALDVATATAIYSFGGVGKRTPPSRDGHGAGGVVGAAVSGALSWGHTLSGRGEAKGALRWYSCRKRNSRNPGPRALRGTSY